MTLLKKLKQKQGEGYIDVSVVILAAVMCIALIISVAPVFIAKNRLDTFAVELVREAEIAGRVASETNDRAIELKEQLEIDPKITWSKNGQLQIDTETTVTVTMTVDIGFGGFGSFPIELTAKATGKSEVYWK